MTVKVSSGTGAEAEGVIKESECPTQNTLEQTIAVLRH